MFTRKHYEAIAEVIRNTYAVAWDGTEVDGIANVEEGLVRLFAKDNSRFDPDKFKAACNAV